jgi:NADPH:quinone reductase-like Zn-dependent oxidoreductase
MTQIPANALQLRSTLKSTGVLELSLASMPVPAPGPDDVLIEVQASPINPSDLGLLLGPADLSKAEVTGAGADLILTAPVSEAALRALAGRVDQSMAVGNEGAGLVVKAGASPAAQALVGKTVAVFGGSMYSQYRLARAADCLVLPPGTTPAEGASCFVNPLTALGMVGTMRREGHTALVHTAAASNLGQMLNKICLKDGVDLVNIVRSAEQADILTRIGAKHVVDSSRPSFMADLIAALTATGATLAFDAIGGGKLANTILTGMEAAANANAKTYSRYGSTVHKQVYIYGGLDMGPTELNRGYGMAWGVGGWLLTPFLQKIGPEGANELRARVVAELKTTFASHYVAEISLADVLNPDVARKYNLRGTGAKYLVNPNKS